MNEHWKKRVGLRIGCRDRVLEGEQGVTKSISAIRTTGRDRKKWEAQASDLMYLSTHGVTTNRMNGMTHVLDPVGVALNVKLKCDKLIEC